MMVVLFSDGKADFVNISKKIRRDTDSLNFDFGVSMLKHFHFCGIFGDI